jgi:hypothetical protein
VAFRALKSCEEMRDLQRTDRLEAYPTGTVPRRHESAGCQQASPPEMPISGVDAGRANATLHGGSATLYSQIDRQRIFEPPFKAQDHRKTYRETTCAVISRSKPYC